MTVESLVFATLTLVTGAIIGWLARAQRPPVLDTRVEDELRSRCRTLEEQVFKSNETLVSAQRATSDAEARATSLADHLSEERANLEKLNQKIQTEFEAISNKLLLNSAARFTEQSSKVLQDLLHPLKEKLTEFKSGMDDAREASAANNALLKNQIERIGNEAANLTKALKGDVKVLGTWGENMLDQLLEASGLKRDLHYSRQFSVRDSSGQQRFLDVIIRLPEGQNIVIDSKVSLSSYEEYVNCADPQLRVALLQTHIGSLRTHFRGLGSKSYQSINGINAPDFVLMYIPIEAAYIAAVSHEPALFNEALTKHNVVLITNSTLLATLRTVSHVWRLADQQKNASEIADRGAKLYDKFAGFVDDMQTVGDSLKKSQETWQTAMNKLCTGRGNLLKQAEELRELGVKPAKSLPPELIEQANDSDRQCALLLDSEVEKASF